MLIAPRKSPLRILAAIFLCASLAACDHRADDYKILQAAISTIDAQTAAITSELKALPARTDVSATHWTRQWGGEYYTGDGLGTNIRINIADAGITITDHGCGGLYGGNYGSIVEAFDEDGDTQPDGIKVKWVLGRSTCDNYDCEKLYFISWDGAPGCNRRRYLVPETKMNNFVNAYNHGGIDRELQFSAPRMEEILPDGTRAFHGPLPAVVGMPHMPAKWAKKLKYTSREATITQIISRDLSTDAENHTWIDARIKIDRGSDDGMQVGTRIAIDQRDCHGILTIDKLTSHAAEGTLRIGAGRPPSPCPAIGQVFPTDQRRDPRNP